MPTYCPMTVHLVICGHDCPGCDLNYPERLAAGEHPCDVGCGADRMPEECGKVTGNYACPIDAYASATA